MNTYLIHAPHDQKIKTVENVDTKGILVYSNPKYYETKKLARDYGDIKEGDQVIICRDSELKHMAVVDEVVKATDQSGSKHDGLPVKILKGHVIEQLNKLKVVVFIERMMKEGIEPPNLINPKLSGFKMGAFVERLTEVQLRTGLGYD